MKRCFALFSIYFCFVFTGCGSKELTRSRAAEIIAKNIHFPEVITGQVRLGHLSTEETSFEKFTSANPGGIWYKILSEKGQLSLSWQGISKSTSGVYTVNWGNVFVVLNPSGTKYQLGPEQDDATGKYINVKLCDKQFDEVTGITAIDQSNATVEYKWKFENLTPFGNAQIDMERQMGGRWAACSQRGVRIVSVRMRRYDDGWRFLQ